MAEVSPVSIRRYTSLLNEVSSTTGVSGQKPFILREKSNTSTSPTLYMVITRSKRLPPSTSDRASTVDSALVMDGGLLRLSSA